MILDRNGSQILDDCVLMHIQSRELMVVAEVSGFVDFVEVWLRVLESPARGRVGCSVCMSYFRDYVVCRPAYEVLR